MSQSFRRAILKASDGTIFTVSFVKKDGTFRRMNCRTGVSKGVAGTASVAQKSVDERLGYLTVYDMQSMGFRKINLDTVLEVKIKGEIIKL